MNAQGSTSGEVYAVEEMLVTIPRAVVHLIDGEDSVHLATGDFSLIRLKKDANALAIFATVGDALRWPIVKDGPTTKLDSCHYFFSFTLPPDEKNGDKDEESDTLHYGVTFAVEGQDSQLKQLDGYLEQYSYFSAPSLVQGASGRKEEFVQDAISAEQKAETEEGSRSRNPLELMRDFIFRKPNPPVKPSSLPDLTASVPVGASDMTPSENKQLIEEKSAEFWTTLAPNVEDYNSMLAKGIAAGSGHIIRGMFWCSDTTVAQLQKGSLYMKQRVQPNDKATHISPRTMKNIRRVKKMSKMTDKVAKAVLQGILNTTGIITGSIIKSKAGQKFFKLVPGEVALASLDGFNKLFDAVEVAGKNVLTSTNEVTSGLVSHRYGSEAGEATKEGLSTCGHFASTAWTVSKIRKALNPKDGAKSSKSGLVKTAGKAVLNGAKTKT
eukprot:c23003_g1_i1 orf=358-1674(+)